MPKRAVSFKQQQLSATDVSSVLHDDDSSHRHHQQQHHDSSQQQLPGVTMGTGSNRYADPATAHSHSAAVPCQVPADHNMFATFGDLFTHLLCQRQMLCLGLYRLAWHIETELAYVYTNPDRVSKDEPCVSCVWYVYVV